jgi:methionine sulfoxide reductase heme-binding subunit
VAEPSRFNPLLTPGGRHAVWWLLFAGLSLPWLFLLAQWGLLLTGLSAEYREYYVLTANPIEYTNRFLGDWALRFLILALTVTPLSKIFNLPQLIAYRRMTGVYAFSYVCLHLTSYTVLDNFFDFAAIWADILKRNYITLGMTAFTLLIPLAVTSTRGWVKRLGSKAWKNIHRLVYVAAPVAATHYIFMAKGHQRQPWVYLGIVVALLLIRLAFRALDKRKGPKGAPAASV